MFKRQTVFLTFVLSLSIVALTGCSTADKLLNRGLSTTPPIVDETILRSALITQEDVGEAFTRIPFDENEPMPEFENVLTKSESLFAECAGYVPQWIAVKPTLDVYSDNFSAQDSTGAVLVSSFAATTSNARSEVLAVTEKMNCLEKSYETLFEFYAKGWDATLVDLTSRVLGEPDQRSETLSFVFSSTMSVDDSETPVDMLILLGAKGNIVVVYTFMVVGYTVDDTLADAFAPTLTDRLTSASARVDALLDK